MYEGKPLTYLMNFKHLEGTWFSNNYIVSDSWQWRIAKYATPKYAASVYWLFWAVNTWKIGFHWTLLPKGESSKIGSVVINVFHRSFISQGILALITQERRLESEPHLDKLGHRSSYFSPSLLRYPSSFLNITYSLLKGLHFPPLSLLRWYVRWN